MSASLVARLAERVSETAKAVRWGAGPADRARIAAVMLLTPLRRRLPVGRREHRLRLALDGDVVPWTASSDGDLRVLDEIFGGRIYEADGPDPEVIVDLGSHLGASILYFRRRYPRARIVGFEPDPVTFRRLARHVSGLPGVEVHHLAVAGADGPMRFYASGEGDSWASSAHRSTPWQREIEVEGLTLASALERAGVDRVDLLKIDIEGAEADVLAGWPGLRDVRVILGEVHPELMSATLDEFRVLLDGFETDLPARVEGSTAFRAVRENASLAGG